MRVCLAVITATLITQGCKGDGKSSGSPVSAPPVSIAASSSSARLPSATASSEAASPLLTMDQVLSAFRGAGFRNVEYKPKISTLIGAEDGGAVSLDGESVEVYIFATDITSGREALERLQKDGLMGQRMLVRKNVGMLEAKRNRQWEKIKAAFEAL